MIPGMMLEYLDQLYFLVGRIVIAGTAALLLLAFLVAVLILYSFKTRRFFAARLMLIGLSMVENLVKALFWLTRADDSIVDDVGVSLRNYINHDKFYRTPIASRFIFMPQCVRSIECPAKLTPEGIKCVDCGRCDVGAAKKFSEGMGYRFFIVPGSSFIKRIIRKYRPKAIIGVGCQMEIKEGLVLCHSQDIPAIGVPLSKAGCVSTTLDWDAFYEVINGPRGGQT